MVISLVVFTHVVFVEIEDVASWLHCRIIQYAQ
jgi:hypothetical protein